MKIWIVIYSHRHGLDVWPTKKEMSEGEVIEDLKKQGSWDERDENDDLTYVEVRGPYECR